ncbi:MAG: amino acid transport protein [Oligoflexia bacterium]|nr:amino acid transport protein [Oligoflexia bacterium]
MNISTSTILCGIIFGSLGLYFLKVGKSLAKVDLLLYGLVLLVYPYFTENDWLLWGIGTVTTVLCFRSIRRP